MNALRYIYNMTIQYASSATDLTELLNQRMSLHLYLQATRHAFYGQFPKSTRIFSHDNNLISSHNDHIHVPQAINRKYSTKLLLRHDA